LMLPMFEFSSNISRRMSPQRKTIKHHREKKRRGQPV
jgi:hypothetical protein